MRVKLGIPMLDRQIPAHFVVVHLASGGAELHSITQRRNVNAEERFGAT